MIIKFKVADDSGEWQMFDRCSEVRFDTTWHTVKGPKAEPADIDWQKTFGYADLLHVLGWSIDCEDDGSRIVRWVRWVGPHPATGVRCQQMLVTDYEPVFILGDDGQTIDRV